MSYGSSGFSNLPPWSRSSINIHSVSVPPYQNPGGVIYPIKRPHSPDDFSHSYQQSSSSPKPRSVSGYVTKLYESWGIIDGEIQFSFSACTKGIPKLKELVSAEAIPSPGTTYKWRATKVALITNGRDYSNLKPISNSRPESDYRRAREIERSRDRSRERRYDDVNRSRERSRERRYDEIDRNRERSRERRYDDIDRNRERSRERRYEEIDRKRFKRDDRDEKIRDYDRDVQKEREKIRDHDRSPPRRSKSPPKHRLPPPFRYDIKVPSDLLALSEGDVTILRKRYPSLYIPSDFFSSTYCWPETFPTTNPFVLNKPCSFHIMHKDCDSYKQNDAVLEPPDLDYAFSAKVMLMSIPRLDDVYKKTLLMAETLHKDDERNLTHLSHLITFLVGSREKSNRSELLGIGGPWSPSLDGENPDKNPSVLIKTAIRTCKALTGVDLSVCSQWYRFMEVYYHRSESVYKGKIIPARVETVVFFLPEVWDCVPSCSEWNDVILSYKKLLEDKLHPKPADESVNHAAPRDQADESDKEEDLVVIDKCEEKIEPTHYSVLDPPSMKVNDLRQELESRGLSVKGLKQHLIQRLELALRKERDLDEDDIEIGKEVKASLAKIAEDAKIVDKEIKVTADHKEIKVTADDKEVKVTADGKEIKVTADDKEVKVTADGKEIKVTADDKEIKVAADDKEIKVTADDTEIKVTADDKENKVTADDKEIKVTADDKENKVTADDKEIKVTTDDKIKSTADDTETKVIDDVKETKGLDDLKLDDVSSSEESKESRKDILEEAEVVDRAVLEKRYTLPISPHIVVHSSRSAREGKFYCYNMSLANLLFPKANEIKEHSFELFLFAKLFNEMLQRDFGFRIYKAICAATEKSKEEKDKEQKKLDKDVSMLNSPERGSKSEEKDKKEEKPDKNIKLDSKTRGEKSDHDEIKKKERVKLVTKDPYLLLSFMYFDRSYYGYLGDKDVESIIFSLGLRLSRHQAKKLISKVAVRDTIYYRKFTDKPELEEYHEEITDVASLALGNRKYLPIFRSDGSPELSQSKGNSEKLENDSADSATKSGGMVCIEGTVVDVEKVATSIKKSESMRFELESQLLAHKKEIDTLRESLKRLTEKEKRVSEELKMSRENLSWTNREKTAHASKSRSYYKLLMSLKDQISSVEEKPERSSSRNSKTKDKVDKKATISKSKKTSDGTASAKKSDAPSAEKSDAPSAKKSDAPSAKKSDATDGEKKNSGKAEENATENEAASTKPAEPKPAEETTT